MKIKPMPVSPKIPQPDITLTKVLDKNEEVKDLVEEAAVDLSSLNTDLKQGLATETPPPKVEEAIKKSEAAENKVLEAAEKLAVINEELESEVHELHALQQRFAATVNDAAYSRHAALHDVLTGLPNRGLFRDRLEHGLEQAKRHGWTLAVLFVDLDGFKAINDSYGHAIGDSVLKLIAARLRENARSDDTVSRHGGDEFLYLLTSGGDALDIEPIASKILKTVQQPCDIQADDVDAGICIGASIGIAIFPQDGSTADTLVKNADAAMYRAKRSKAGYVFASASAASPG